MWSAQGVFEQTELLCSNPWTKNRLIDNRITQYCRKIGSTQNWVNLNGAQMQALKCQFTFFVWRKNHQSETISVYISVRQISIVVISQMPQSQSRYRKKHQVLLGFLHSWLFAILSLFDSIFYPPIHTALCCYWCGESTPTGTNGKGKHANDGERSEESKNKMAFTTECDTQSNTLWYY